MSQPIKKILVLTSGGDAPGMNAAIRAVVRTGIHQGLEVYGSENGYTGLINKHIHKLDETSVANCIQRGGTVLKTGRCAAFYERAARDQVRHQLAELSIDALVVLGGDGSFRGASILRSEGGPVCIGVPCTIDNDITGTEYTIGFDTACNTALHAIDNIRDTASSFNRNFIVEVMGRSTGFIAVHVGMAGGAEFILTPEFPIDTKTLADKMKHKRRKKMASIIVAAEADQPGRSVNIAKEIQQLTGTEYRVCILGHIQRGGSPSVYDRGMASVMGSEAVHALLAGKSDQIVALQRGRVVTTEMPTPENATRYFSDQRLLEINEVICDVN